MGCCFSGSGVVKRESGSDRANVEDLEVGKSAPVDGLKKRPSPQQSAVANVGGASADVTKGIESTRAWGSIEPVQNAVLDKAEPRVVGKSPEAAAPVIVDKRPSNREEVKPPAQPQISVNKASKPAPRGPSPTVELKEQPKVSAQPRKSETASPSTGTSVSNLSEKSSAEVTTSSDAKSQIAKRAEMFEKKKLDTGIVNTTAAAPSSSGSQSSIAKRAEQFQKQQAEAAEKKHETGASAALTSTPGTQSSIAKRAEQFQKEHSTISASEPSEAKAAEPKPSPVKIVEKVSAVSYTVESKENPALSSSNENPENATERPASTGKSAKIAALQAKMGGIPLGGFGPPPGGNKPPQMGRALPGMSQTLPSRPRKPVQSEDADSDSSEPSSTSSTSGQFQHYTLTRPIIKAGRRPLSSIQWNANNSQ
eukprot:TRINITY_DN26739_c0_g1_i1.p1 TRINITY_DN26739_c0_g1~~TRINITY_DN26739_c0_g1_i1.p1  ORF type:complete len:423 (-),score=105.13 TRINITY_DN26739_c0_g1_i1:54-1322(-)